MLNSQGLDIIQNIIMTDIKQIPVVDHTIDERHINNLSGIYKIPNGVRSLREFSGKPSESSFWKKSVESILQIYEHTKGTWEDSMVIFRSCWI